MISDRSRSGPGLLCTSLVFTQVRTAISCYSALDKLHCGTAHWRSYVQAACGTIPYLWTPLQPLLSKLICTSVKTPLKVLYKLVKMYDKTFMDKAGNKLKQGVCYHGWFGFAESFVFCRKLKIKTVVWDDSPMLCSFFKGFIWKQRKIDVMCQS